MIDTCRTNQTKIVAITLKNVETCLVDSVFYRNTGIKLSVSKVIFCIKQRSEFSKKNYLCVTFRSSDGSTYLLIEKYLQIFVKRFLISMGSNEIKFEIMNKNNFLH